MKKQIVTLLASLSLISFISIPTESLAAGTATGTLAATATVSAKCVVDSTTNVTFGTVDPTTAGNYDGTGTIVTHCSKNTQVFIWVAPSVAGVLKMTSPTTLDSITYTLFSNTGRTTVFPSVTGGAKATQPGTPVTTTLYGRVVVGSGVNDTVAAATDYTQALTATIEW